MSNWCTNTIICKEDLLSHLLNSDKEVDFGILIPEPTSKEQCLADFGEDYIDKGDLQHTATPDWYNWRKWRIDFWGSDSNSTDTDVVRENGYCYIRFDTDAIPIKWFDKLIALGKPFIHFWDSEDGGIGGAADGYNGNTEFTRSWSYNSDNPEEDSEFPPVDVLKAFFGD